MTSPVAGLIFTAPEAFEAVLPIHGDLPDYVRGSYYLNGPALFQRGATTYRHWLDGDALLRCLRFSDGRVTYTSRYLGSQKHREEAAAGRPVYRNFGTAFEGDRLNDAGVGLEANINVSAYRAGTRLLAFGEQALPLEIDPDSLETLGVCDFAGALKPLSPFSGHPKFDPVTGGMANFGVQFLGKRGLLHYYEFDAALTLKTKGSASLPMAANMHDFALSPHYACFITAPYVLDVRAVAREGKCLQEALHWAPEQGTGLLLLHRADGRPAARVALPESVYCLHLINAFEAEGLVTVDFIAGDRPFFDQYHREALFADIRPCGGMRLVVDPARGVLVSQNAQPSDLHLDFPAIRAGAQGRHTEGYWALGMPVTPGQTPKFYTSLLYFEGMSGKAADAYHAPAGYVLSGEPVHLPDPTDPAGGLIMIQQHHPADGQSRYVLLDVGGLHRGPRATIPVGRFDPMGFHASWQPEA